MLSAFLRAKLFLVPPFGVLPQPLRFSPNIHSVQQLKLSRYHIRLPSLSLAQTMPVKTKLTDLIARCRNSPNLNPPSRRSQPSSFLDLPLELRQQIYRYVLVSPDIIRAKFLCRRWLPDDFWLYATRDTSIFLASRQVSAEALDVFYGDNVFQVPLHGGEENVFHRLSEACRQRIRRLELITIPVAIPYGKKSQLKLDDRYWPSVLADLTELRLVAQGPKTQFYYYDTVPLEQCRMTGSVG